MSKIWVSICIEIINILGSFVATILMRWLLGISTPEKDYTWLKSRGWYKKLIRLKFYRGQEYLYQLRSRKIYGTTN